MSVQVKQQAAIDMDQDTNDIDEKLPVVEAPEIVVDWTGDDDPDNPLNWKRARKGVCLAIISLFTFCSPLSATYPAGVSPQLAERYGIQSPVMLALLTSSFFIAFALGPLLLGPLSEVYGRVPITHLAASFVVVFNLVLPWAPSAGVFILFRLFAGFGAAAPLAIGAGIISDMFISEQRGQAVALWSLFPLLGPILGPMLGSFIQEYTTWHWVFWSIALTTATCQIAALLFFRESFAPVILERKATAIRKETTAAVRTKFTVKYTGTADFINRALMRPLKMLVYEPIVLVLAIVNLVVFGLLFLMLVTIGGTFSSVYNWSDAKAGLVYIALGLGVLTMSQTQGLTSDRIAAALAARNGGVRKPEYRLPWLLPSAFLLPSGFLIYGWSAQYQVHWIVPCIGLFLLGAGNIGFMQPTQVYAIETFQMYAASALAAILTLRSFAGFAFPLFGSKLTEAIGLGWGCTILAGVAVVFCGFAGASLWLFGERLRAASRMSAT